jgi:uncharacterized repeat protein (TIGR03803 family)
MNSRYSNILSFAVFVMFLMLPAMDALGQSANSSVPAPTPWTITSRSANSRIWQRTTYELSPSGQVIPHLHQYTELGTGICYQQPGGDGQWLDSQEAINILQDGTASATNGQHQVFFPIDIYDGTITLIKPDGIQMVSQPVGLFYDDGTNTVIIAQLTNSVGQLVSDNRVIYTNAFTGIDADLLYTYTKAGFEQDVILDQQPKSPEFYGLNPQDAQLEMLTEFLNPPEPAITTMELPEQAGLALADDTMDFGTMRVVPGRAFLIGTNANESQVLVAKQWLSVGGRQFLAEAVPVAAIADQLSLLPGARFSSIKQKHPLKFASAKRFLPSHERAGKTNGHLIRVTQAKLPRRGLLFDYQIINSSQTNVTFRGDNTYYISNSVSLFGTNTFEAGTVIKFGTNGAISQSGGKINWTATAYSPVILTAKDDNSVGEAINGSTGIPIGYYGNPALDLIYVTSPQVISNFRIAYASQAVSLQGICPNFYDGQVVDCQNGFSLSGIAGIELANILFANVETNFNEDSVDLYAKNCTFSSSTNLIAIKNLPYQGDYLFFTNCIFANILNLTNSYGSAINFSLVGRNNGFYDSPTFGADYVTTNICPFQVVGGGSYYLTNGCVFRGAGTPNIDPALLADLSQKTTYPPIVFDVTNISSLATLSPAVPRDTNAAFGLGPDLGYHYLTLDYVFGASDLYSNLTFTTGTAVGWFEDYGAVSWKYLNGGLPYYGISLNDGASLSFNGNAMQPDYFVKYNNVQEGLNGNWTDSSYLGAMIFNGSDTNYEPQLSANFTKFSQNVAGGNFFRDDWAYGAASFENCEIYTAPFSTYEMQAVDFTNCLLFRCDASFYSSGYQGASQTEGYAVSYAFENCTFYNGSLFSGRYDNTNSTPFEDAGLSSSLWSIENCAIDGTGFSWSDCLNGNSTNTFFNYNAFNTNNLGWTNFSGYYGTNEVVGANDQMLTNYNWETSWFGTFYQPTNSLTFQAGSTNANLLGLYWFTTQTNQTIEGTNRVTIGYHFVATDTNGNPLDNLDSPVPNYLSDPSGASNFLTIVTQPASLTVTQGYNATFSVLAEGAPLPLSYQWFFDDLALSDGVGVSGSTSATLNLSAVQPDFAGNYYVVVTNGFGSVTSSIATLIVVPTPVSSVTNFPFPQYVLTPGTYWNVTDISDPGQPVNIGALEAPFSETDFDNGNFGGNGIYLPNTLWHTNTTVIVTNAYGATEFGGISNMGTVFEIGLTGGISTIYTFTNANGAYPCSQLAISGSTYYGIPNTLYGTTLGGGSNGYGTVFRLNADGGGFTNLYDFTGTNDGEFPQTGLLIDGSTLYGTTSNSIFKINTDGSDFTCLTNVTNASQLILSLSGATLYGTTYSGGVSNEGTLFSINTDGSGFTNFYTFTGGTSGAFPMGGLELYEVGNFLAVRTTTLTLFGTTYSGGASNLGMVFSINIDGSDFIDLHDFTGTNDGAYPVGGLLITNNNVDTSDSSAPLATTYLYGTTSAGGASNCGTIFGIGTNGSNFQTLYSFRGTNGANPKGKLVSTIQALYGTTASGSVHNSGAAFKINYDGSDFTNLYDFPTNSGTPCAGLALPVVDNWASIWSLDTTINASSNNVSNLVYSLAFDNSYALYVNGTFVSQNFTTSVGWLWPPSSLAPYLHPGDNDIRVIIGGDNDMNDYFAMVIRDTSYDTVFTNLYGTASAGGTNGDGTVFEIGPDGYETNLYTFSGPPGDGQNPIGDLVLCSNTLYGVTEAGGANREGSIFSFTFGSTSDAVLHSFNYTDIDDGQFPAAGLVLSGNVLYGTTEGGGTNGGSSGGHPFGGTIFRINTDGSGYRVLHSFSGANNGDGFNPMAPLLLVSNNTLYGTTKAEGPGNGTLFCIATNGANYQILHGFGTNSNDGSAPLAGLVLDGTTLYGTTSSGGSNGDGTVFSYNLINSNYDELYSFAGAPDGNGPAAGLALSGSTLYGTTADGGAWNIDGGPGQGTIFSIGTNGNGETILRSLGTIDTDRGANPQADMIILGGLLYGTMPNGGAADGMAFSISTNGADFNDIHDFTNNPDGAMPEGGLGSP